MPLKSLKSLKKSLKSFERPANAELFSACEECGEVHIMCSEGGFATHGSGYAISVFSNGMGNVWKNGRRVPGMALKNVPCKTCRCHLEISRFLLEFS